MKKIKISLFAIIAIVMGVAGSAFTNNPVEKVNSVTYFYEYTSSSTLKDDVQNIDNYVRRTKSCNSGIHVCGVSLEATNPSSQKPDVQLFNDVKDDLWASEQNGTSTIPGVIEMRN